MLAITATTIPHRLRTVVPEFGPMIDEHVAFYGDVLLHVLFGDLTRFVLELGVNGASDTEQRCLDFLDHALQHGDDAVRNAIQVSFVENVGPWDPSAADFIARWPAALREEAHRQAAGARDQKVRRDDL